MLNPSDLPVLRRATFRAPALESEPEHAPSKRRRTARSKGAADGVEAATTVELTAEPASIDATRATETTPVIQQAVATATVSIAAAETVPAIEATAPAETATDDATEPADPTETDTDELAADGPVEVTDTRRGTTTPRHRAERVRNRRAVAGKPGKSAGKGAGASVRRTAALGSAMAFIGLSAFGALIPADAEASDSVAESATADLSADSIETIAEATRAATKDSLTPAVAAEPLPAITSGLSTAAAPFTGGTQVTVQGRSLDEVASVTVGSTPATIVAVDDAQITFQVPAVAQASTGAAVDVTMTDAAGQPVEVVTTEAPASSVAGLISSVATAEVKGAATVGEKTAAPLTLTYTSDAGIDAQLAYVATYWSSYNSAQYPVFGGVDCANFASQSLVARGWAMDGGWFYDGSTGTMSSSWSSSTALRDYLLSQPARATALDDSQRAQVKVGDIAQFDWDSSGDRDHTAVVTRVEQTDAGTRVWVGGHTKDIDYWDVDEALASGGGSVTYFSIH
ncbi:amidase domain-containing protein [Agromyces sp. PvR057]|uniref:amidase domain-containing protein n=1 Tax=Agromyces sp. PvR057 TaxID=3156403 RepID=UPI00339AB7A6